MGEVWRARHKMLGREAAIKLIRPETLADGSSERARVTLRRFEKEARATAALRSPHTIELYDFGLTEDGTFFYAMELLEGYDLQTLVESHGPLPPARAIHLLRQVCESLAEAHHRGLVHRDVKPANVFTCRLGLKVDFVKVLDLGLVKGSATGEGSSDTDLTVEGAVPGSPAFMAPEAIRGQEKLDGKTDLYSLGCVAFWLLTGSRVFEGRNSLELVLAHLQDPPPSPSSGLDSPLPAQLEAVVLECLAKDPEDRPAGAEEISRRLAAVPLDEPWTEERAGDWWTAHPPPLRQRLLEGEVREPTEPADSVITADWETLDPGDRPAAAPEQLAAGPGELSSEAIVDRLRQYFDRSHIDVFEFDRRSKRAQLASSPADLRGVLEGLPELDLPGDQVPAVLPLAGGEMARRPRNELAEAGKAGLPVRAGDEWKSMVAVFGGTGRKGAWRPERRIRVTTVFGGAEFDFRQAKLRPGMTEINCRCVFGGAKIIVPPGLHVQMDGVGVMGAFTDSGDQAEVPEDDESWLKITGFAVFGGVEVEVKGPHQSLGDRLRKLLPG
jgi:serine/threonine protein kinase